MRDFLELVVLLLDLCNDIFVVFYTCTFNQINNPLI